MASHGFLPANAAQGLHLLSEPPATEVLTACPPPRGSGGWVGRGSWKAALKWGLGQLLGSQPPECLVWGREERKLRFAEFGHAPSIATCERRQQPTHFNTRMPLERYPYD